MKGAGVSLCGRASDLLPLLLPLSHRVCIALWFCSVVFEFSKDVQELLKVLTSREEAMAERVRKLETLFSDWERLFGHPGADLVAAGVTREGNRNTPEAVARRVLELAAAKSSLLSSKTASSGSGAVTSPEAALIRTLQAELNDAHLALRDSSRIAREQAAADVQRIRKEADAAVAAERQARFNAERALLVEQQRAAEELARALDDSRDEAETRRQAEVAELQRQAEEAAIKAEDEKGFLETEIEGLRRELSRMQGELADEKARHAAEEARLIGERLDTERLMEQRLKRAESTLRKTEEAWSLRLQDAEERYARCSSIQRMQGMETELQFLRARQRELEDVVIALQEALVNGSGMPSSLLPGRATATATGSKNPTKAGVVVAALRPAPPSSVVAAAGGSSPVAAAASKPSKPKGGHRATVASVAHVGAATAGAAVRREMAAAKALVSSATVERHHHHHHQPHSSRVAPPAVPLADHGHGRVLPSADDVLKALPGTATAWIVS